MALTEDRALIWNSMLMTKATVVLVSQVRRWVIDKGLVTKAEVDSCMGELTPIIEESKRVLAAYDRLARNRRRPKRRRLPT